MMDAGGETVQSFSTFANVWNEVDTDTCININLDHRPPSLAGQWYKVPLFSKITTT